MDAAAGRTRVVGLTGGIGSGKSTVARMLAERGAAVVDADALAREVVAPGEPALEAIRQRFGDGVIAPDGTLDRKALGAIVFADGDARRDLEAITHPRIAERAQERLEAHRKAGAKVVVYEAALIVEKRLYTWMDGLIVVAASPETQIRRVMDRDGVSESEARRRLDAQLPLSEKVAVADWVVDNDGPLEETAREVDRIWETLRNAAIEQP
jgi:dephospho-CoA kinase